MALTASQTKTLRRKARTNALEVEDLLKYACIGGAKDAETLRGLATELDWSRGPGGAGNEVPFGNWSDVACAYLEAGYPGVEAFAQDERLLPYCLGLLSELKSPDGVELLNRLAVRYPASEHRMEIASSLNLVCSFDGAPDLPVDVRNTARAWLHNLLDTTTSSHERAIVACALRGIGDEESIERLRQLPRFASPWEETQNLCIHAIEKRLSGMRALTSVV